MVASATTRFPRVRRTFIWECFLSVSIAPESTYLGCPGWFAAIHSHAAEVARPTMFWPAASPVV